MQKFIFFLILIFCSFSLQNYSIAEEIITNSLGMRFVPIYSGTFQMGSPESETGRRWNEEKHKVTISKAFYMQETEVTQGQWEKLVGFNPSTATMLGKKYPVDTVSWNQCIEFIRVLNGFEKTDKYRLPTEAEWEFACRAGSTTAFSSGEITQATHASCIIIDPALNKAAWYCANSGEQNPPGKFRAHPVKTKLPNAWGLYDMHGNVQEWVQDSCIWKQWIGRIGPITKTYENNVVDPISKKGKHKIIRGGGWHQKPIYLRSAQRNMYKPVAKRNSLGFRIVRER
ncbi:MAG: formylglycine-generating enzyme family protein [Desulfobacteraceae bacterium]|nr:formylglycine-generating enzyme family protein [Desulfobacteraceae bacterium]